MSRIKNVNTSRVRFEPGDKLLIRVPLGTDHEAMRRIKHAFQKWTGSGIDILVIPENAALFRDRNGQIEKL